MEILIIIALVLLNGVFSMSEMSLVSSRKFKLESARNKGNKGAITAIELSENPTQFLSTVQIGITLIGILLGVYSGENLTNDLAAFLTKIAIIAPYANNIAVGLIVLFVTYLSIVLGELLPKRIGMTFPEPIAIILAKPMKILSIITSPFVWLLTITNNFLLGIMGINKSGDNIISEEEIKSIIKESAELGEIQDIEQDIVERVFELGDRDVSSLFTHRNDFVYFNIEDSWETIMKKINEEKHSAYPVCSQNNLDKILGIVLIKDLFEKNNFEAFKIQDYIKKPVFLNESTKAYKVLEIFKKEKMHYGLVLDEYGSTMGIITMDDVVDALVGDVTESEQEEYEIVEREDGSWWIDAQLSVHDFAKYFDLQLDPEIQNRYTTVAGYVTHGSSKIPNVGDLFIVDQYEIEIVDKDGQRIDKLLMKKKKV